MAEDKNVDDVWTERINAFWDGLLKVLQILGPVLTAFVLYMQSQTHSKIAEAKAEIKNVAETAATNAENAAIESKAVKTEIAASVKDRQQEFKAITEKQDKTHEALAKVIEPMEKKAETSRGEVKIIP